MTDLRDLYQEVILDHGKSPRNFGLLETKTSDAHGHNPLCGDTVTIYIEVDGTLIKDVTFEVKGCAISIASASLMTDILKGKQITEAQKLFDLFHAMVSEDSKDIDSYTQTEDLEKLNVLAGVRNYPMRVKCATLPWHAFNAAIAKGSKEVTTE